MDDDLLSLAALLEQKRGLGPGPFIQKKIVCDFEVFKEATPV